MSNNEILLESGTNELEVLEFAVAGIVFGINVAKVNQILLYEKLKPMPNSHPYVEGIFKLRDKILTVIDLAGYMNLPHSESTDRDYFIVTHFNNIDSAFHVHSVEGIHRISWNMIEKPDATIYGGAEGLATGIAKVKDKLITIIDFEKIIFDISPLSGIRTDEIEHHGSRVDKPIFIADDSVLLERQIIESLHKAGYQNVSDFSNGQEAWNRLLEIKEQVEAGTPLESLAACVITDIEMPKMDGHRLTKLIKNDPVLKKLPVIIFSSLIDEEMRKKGEELGADAQLTKPDIGKLISALDQKINNYDAHTSF
ncbi:MAG: chemotaxis protein [Oscillospiraceae bacterium]|nr:chemotaxis protein [Oscillospiraceae bacterium]